VARRIGEHYCSGREPWSAEQLARHLQQPLAAVEETLAAFTAAGLLVPAQSDPVAYLPKHAIDTVPLSDLLRAIRSTGNEPFIAREEAVDALIEAISDAQQQALAGRTWRDLIMPGGTANPLPEPGIGS